jgi:uncharacterized membrane protein
MSYLIVGLAVFLGIHSVSIVAPEWRVRMIARMGEQPWKGAFSVISIASFVLLVYGYGQARMTPVVLYSPPQGLRHLALLLMLPVFPMFVSTYFPGRIKSTLKHPMLVSIKLWAVAHLLANGTLNDVILFGAFLVWAVADRISVKRRSAAEQHHVPEVPPRPFNDAIAVVIGLAIYVAFVLAVHRWLIGVSPLAGMGGS